MRTIITPIAFLFCLSVSAQNIALDGNFGYEGFTFVENTSEINKVILNPDGTIISAGYRIVNGGYYLALTKHQADGTLITGFGTNGITYTVIGYSDMVHDLKLQPDGKILVSGSTYLGSPSEESHAFIVRYNSNGIIDLSFAANGIFIDTNYAESEFTSVISQADGSLLLLGNGNGRSYLTRLTSAGVLDNTFGTNGITYISDFVNYFFINSGAIRLSDGSILCYGMDGTSSSGSFVTCAKIDPLGNYITSFGQNGIASFDLELDPNTIEMISSAQELPDGKIILAADITDQHILKLKADGTLDSTFADNGVVTHTLPYKDMVVQTDGKILIGGSTLISPANYGFSISRFNADGTIDPGFNGTGTFEIDLSERSDFLQSMILTNSDHLLIGGSTRQVDLNSTFGLAKIDIGQTLGLQADKSEEVSLYPNPFTNELTVSIGNDNIKEIQLKDASGRWMSSYPASTNTTLQLGHLAAGIYQAVFITDQKETFSRKLIKL